MKEFRSTIPAKYRDEITLIWNKTGRDPWFYSYVFPGSPHNGIMTRMKNDGMIIVYDKPIKGNAVQRWKLSDWVCNICEKKIGKPAEGYQVPLAENTEQLKEHHRQLIKRCDKTTRDRNRKERAEKAVEYYQPLLSQLYSNVGNQEFTFRQIRDTLPVNYSTAPVLEAYGFLERTRKETHQGIWYWKLTEKAVEAIS